jgi:hypothetical protein
MSTMTAASNISAPTQFLQVKNDVYAYRRFGGGPGRPLLCLQRFMGTPCHCFAHSSRHIAGL